MLGDGNLVVELAEQGFSTLHNLDQEVEFLTRFSERIMQLSSIRLTRLTLTERFD